MMEFLRCLDTVSLQQLGIDRIVMQGPADLLREGAVGEQDFS